MVFLVICFRRKKRGLSLFVLPFCDNPLIIFSVGDFAQKRLETVGLWIFNNVLCLALLGNYAVVHKDYVIGNLLGKGHLMGNDDHCHVLGGKLADKASMFGGVVLIAIGLKILIENFL